MSTVIQEISAKTAGEYFAALDVRVCPGTVLFVFGGAAVAMLGSRIRTTMGVDVAEPFSTLDRAAFAAASAEAGLPVNPGLDYDAAFLELVGPFRLAMPAPDAAHPGTELYRGRNLVVRTGSAADLVASKLVRYDDQDRQDVQFLTGEGGATLDEVREAVSRLQPKFREDAVVCENLKNLEADLSIWGVAK